MKAEKRKIKVLSHPLFLLLAGTVLSSIIIPAIASHWSYTSNNKKLRINLSRDLMEKDIEIKVGINKLKSTLEIFIDDYCLFHDTTQIRNLQDALRTKMNNSYLNFEEVAWFWHANHNLRAYELGVNEPDSLALFLKQYNENVLHTVGTIDPLWGACLKNDFSCNRPYLDSLKATVTENIDSLNFKRADIMVKLIDFISQMKLDRKAII